MTADLVDWQDEYVLDHRRRLKSAAFVSLAVHACVLGLFAATPPRPVAPLPEAISVDLIAAPAPAPRTARSAPAPAPAPKPVAPPPAPAPAVAPPPPIAEAPVQVLPEETPGRIRKAKPKPPKVVAEAKPEPKPEPKPAPPPPPPREEPAYADDEAAMAALMEELGGDEVDSLLKDSAQARADREAALADTRSAGTATGKTELSPEQVAWDRAVIRKVSRNFPMPARARGTGLVAQVEIDIAADGRLMGEPKLVGTSGDRSFDGWALSAIQLSAPFRPPPVPGPRRLNMRSEER